MRILYDENAQKSFSEDLERADCVDNLFVNGRMILKWILGRDYSTGSELGPMLGSFEHRNKTLVSIKGGGLYTS